MTHSQLLEKIEDYNAGMCYMSDVITAVDAYSAALLQQADVSGSLPLSFADIVIKAETRVRMIDTRTFDAVSFKNGYTVGFEDAQRIAVAGNDC